jgi:hypothetical protein
MQYAVVELFFNKENIILHADVRYTSVNEDLRAALAFLNTVRAGEGTPLLHLPQLETITFAPTLKGIEKHEFDHLKQKAIADNLTDPDAVSTIKRLYSEKLLQYLCAPEEAPDLSGVQWPAAVLLYLSNVLIPKALPLSLHHIRIGDMKHHLQNKHFYFLKYSHLRSLQVDSSCGDCHAGNSLVTAEFLTYLPESLETLFLVCFPSLRLPPSSDPAAKCQFPLKLKRLVILGIRLTDMSLGPLPLGLTHLDLRCVFSAMTKNRGGIKVLDALELPKTLLELRKDKSYDIIGLLPPQCSVNDPQRL